MTRDLSYVEKLFRDVGLPWVLLKGLVLNDVVYREPGVRRTSDIDVLLSPADLRQAVAALIATGSSIRGADWSIPTWAHGAEVPIHLPHGSTLDLHWHLVNRPSMRAVYRLPTRDLLSKTSMRILTNFSVPTLDDLDFVLHVLLHACMDGCNRLRAVLDAQQCVDWLIRSGWGPRDLARRARERGLAAPAQLVLASAAHHVDPSLRQWADAFGRSPLWVSLIVTAIRRKAPGTFIGPVGVRATKYVAPTSLQSVTSLLNYGVRRLVRAGRPNRVERLSVPTDPADPWFETWVQRAEASELAAGVDR